MRILRRLPALICISLAVANILSCKKDHSNLSGPCKVVGYYDTVTNRGTYTAYYAQLLRDQEGRLSSALFGEKDSLSNGYVYNYSDNKIVVTPIRTNGPSIDTVTLNSAGLPVTMVFEDVNKTYKTHSDYFYADSGRLNYVIDYDRYGKMIDTVHYYYTNGDVTSVVYSGGSTTRYSYYTDKAANDAEFSRLESVISLGVVTPISKHMMKSVQASGYWANYCYEFDNSGRIVSGEETVTATGGMVTKRTFVYDCSL